eukprot:scaffold67277_cov45-Phaeocystis_antarctica.AAC.3
MKASTEAERGDEVVSDDAYAADGGDDARRRVAVAVGHEVRCLLHGAALRLEPVVRDLLQREADRDDHVAHQRQDHAPHQAAASRLLRAAAHSMLDGRGGAADRLDAGVRAAQVGIGPHAHSDALGVAVVPEGTGHLLANELSPLPRTDHPKRAV